MVTVAEVTSPSPPNDVGVAVGGAVLVLVVAEVTRVLRTLSPRKLSTIKATKSENSDHMESWKDGSIRPATLRWIPKK